MVKSFYLTLPYTHLEHSLSARHFNYGLIETDALATGEKTDNIQIITDCSQMFDGIGADAIETYDSHGRIDTNEEIRRTEL